MQILKYSQLIELIKSIIGKKLLLFSIILLVLGLPLSPFLVGFSQFLLLFNWLLEGKWALKIERIRTNRIIWIFLILPLIHGLWLINTSDFGYALHDIKIKLPLLVFPLIIGTSDPLSEKDIRVVFKFFLFAVFSGTVVTISIITGIYNHPYQDIRETSIYISHIRFGLYIVFSMAIIGEFIITAYKNRQFPMAMGYSLLLGWFLIFLIILQSTTSWIILFFLINFLFFLYYRQIKWTYIKRIGWIILISIFIFCISLIGKISYDFYLTPNPNFADLPTHTKRGNLYQNDTLSNIKENGYYVNVMICQIELEETWPKVSSIPYYGNDSIGYPISGTLIRYLTSKGLPKDQDGIMVLEPEDISMIEKGYASCIYRKKFIPYLKVYDILWELDMYFKTGNANYKSVSQRFEFWKAALFIVKNNSFFGVGTGDLNQEYASAYTQMHSTLEMKNRLRAHNQLLTFLVAFGFVGFILAIISMFYPLHFISWKRNLVLVAFLFIVFLSMINEDTLETQAGVTFYILFYTMLVFSSKKE